MATPTTLPSTFVAGNVLTAAEMNGLRGAFRIVSVNHASLTATQTASVASGANVAVTSLSITHTLAESTNKLIIHAHLGVAANSNQFGMVGLAVANDGTLIEIGDAASNRTRGGALHRFGGNSTSACFSPSITFAYAPGDTSSHTYTVRAINMDTVTNTLYINRNQSDSDVVANPRGSSAFVIMEVSA